ncbi:MAG: polysaccharide pyruvyl transferase family protein [Pseudoflavonifractor capillosus]|uniref:glycosyltransferase n=1 Tax=Pseudoflavonifractor capillosus TaxID=106588 RepID=UPI0023F87F28|nr:glycosyltransferase [Pseudoflavonifractor capillosus]MCI5927317.1 polysaccharide pyruvyl transferase family protein [Pseudoflavonifractor capillosus]MDY4660490.1 glycosyltransferase [Pseudoflavonifractor capillosus]
MTIPKIIHYCWVGGNPKPESVLYCIESWKRNCPDYEIREWNESNYDFTKNEYMRQAYEAKKWGFVPDYARLDIIYEYGGIYLDTDVEVVRSFDEILENECFFGFEDTGDSDFFVNCGHGFGAVPHHEAIKLARDIYKQLSFINADGSLNLLPSPYYTTQVLRQLGLVQKNCDQSLPGLHVYSSEVFCPKTFRTGKLHKTPRTVSIHHFSASWVDEKIKSEMAHYQKVENCLGKRLGRYVLYAESVLQKYPPKDLVTVLPRRSAQKLKTKLITLHDSLSYYRGLAEAKMSRPGTGAPIILDTSMDSDNFGDSIIMENCILQLSACMSVSELCHIPTHRFLTETEYSLLKASSKKILCGTNILSGHMRTYGLWKLGIQIAPYQNTILMGVGFDSKDMSSDFYTRQLLRTILSKDYIHSVRDSFSEQKLNSMGIHNVLNTSCPTMWGLTPDHCKKIPASKASRVVCTVTDYNRDEINDTAMLDILLSSYEKVYLWLQGQNDLDYIRSLGYADKLELIGSALESYDAVLSQNDLDYVGTRLHAGIRALLKGHRSLIISIDNRAECISSDTGLQVLRREDVSYALKKRLYSVFKLNLTLPWENIQQWKSQFKEV